MNLELSFVLLIALTLECITVQIYIINSFKLSLPASRFTIVTVGIYIALFLISLLKITTVNALLFTIANFVIILLFTSVRPLSALFHSLILTIIMAATEAIPMFILNKYTSDYYNENYFMVNGVIMLIISKMLFFFVMLAISVFNRDKFYGFDVDYSLPIFMLIIPIISIVAILVLSAIWFSNYSYIANIQVDVLIPIILFLMVVLNISVFINDYQRRKKYREMTELQLRLQDENNLCNYYQNLLQEYEDRSILIHDMKNHLQSIMNLNADNIAIDDYIQDILSTPAFKPTLVRSDNDLLNAIVTRYYENCTKANIAFTTDIRHGVVSYMQNEDITSLFCNILDNAFEACTGSSDPTIELRIDIQPGSELTIIKLSNSCRTNPLADNKLSANADAIIPTSKKDKKYHGFGLKSVQNVVDKYNGSIKYNYDEESNTFTVTILLMGTP